jgi:hypothetical protein
MDRLQATWLCLILAAGLGAIALSIYAGCRAIAEAIRRVGRGPFRGDGELNARDFASPSDEPDRLPEGWLPPR